MKTGREQIEAERLEQVAKGWTPSHDDTRRKDELAAGGHCYARAANSEMHTGRVVTAVPEAWPFAPTFWKPFGGPVRLLTKAGALYLANMERLVRVGSRKSREQAKRCADLAAECAGLIDDIQSGTWQRPVCQHRRVIVTMEVYGEPEAADALMKEIGAGIDPKWLHHMVRQSAQAGAVGYVDFCVDGERWVPGTPALPDNTEINKTGEDSSTTNNTEDTEE